jgi:hypothetical protein
VVTVGVGRIIIGLQAHPSRKRMIMTWQRGAGGAATTAAVRRMN